MATLKLDRKKLFRMALAADGKTAIQWATEQGIRGSDVSLALSVRENATINELIDNYVASTLKTYKIKVA